MKVCIQIQIFSYCQILIQAKLLRHITDKRLYFLLPSIYVPAQYMQAATVTCQKASH